MSVLMDTCTWLWYVAEDKKLSHKAKKSIKEAQKDGDLFVSIISCWEIAKLVEKDKLKLALPVRDWLNSAIRIEGVALQELTPEICIHSTELPGKFHGDPADQIIVATSRILRVPLITPDKKIQNYRQVKTIW